MNYYLITLTETDGDIQIIKFSNLVELNMYVKLHNIHKEDYNIIYGNLLQ